jgi:TRAP-type C4-dicarboxylate transport system permease small subunit
MADYISVENQKELANSHRTGVKIFFVIALSVLAFMLIARFISPNTTLPGSEGLNRPIFIAVIVLGLGVIAVRRLLMSQLMMAKLAPRGVNALLGRLLMTTVICLAIAALIGIMGFTFFLLTGDYEYSWRLGGVSLFLVLYSFPWRGEWERIISRNTQ